MLSAYTIVILDTLYLFPILGFVLKQDTRGRRQYQEKAEETDYE